MENYLTKIVWLSLFGLMIGRNEISGKPLKVDSLVVFKAKRILIVYQKSKAIRQLKISLGGNPVGHKEKEGDEKTPEGYYIISDKNPNSAFYKNLAISYPNKTDVEKARKGGYSPGGNIKIHGLRNGFGWTSPFHLWLDWTNGCIAVTNKEMEWLFQNVEKGTLIHIQP
jgi:murein L,D-transpeptidase YafK